MGSEQGPVNSPDRRSQHIEVLGLFDRELNSLMYPKTKEGLMEATKNLLIRTFGYSATSAETRTRALDKNYDTPQAYELEHAQESLSENLKLGLFDRLPEEYIILFGKEEFDDWIGPFLRSVLLGHTEESLSYAHLNECPDGGFCPTKIITCFVRDELTGNVARIHGDKAENEGYLPYADDLIYMNVTIVKELVSLGVYSEVEAKDLLLGYEWWLESIEDLPLEYDKTLFD